jgi:hypothetical protein
LRVAIYIISAVFVLNSGCRKSSEADKGRLLAKVFNQSLYLSDMEGMFPQGSKKGDSLEVINAFVERWAHNNVLMHEAEKNIPKDLNVEDLVRNYRNSLILSSYEKQLTETAGLDSTISEAELKEFYEKNQDQYQLEMPIVRCHFLKISKSAPIQDSVQKWWNTRTIESHRKLVDYASKNARYALLDDSTWHKIDKISNVLPKGTLVPENITTGKELTLKDDNFQYYFRAIAVMSQKEIAPLSYIKEQASKYILHIRKNQILEKKQKEMFDTELRKNNVKIYAN